MSAPPPGHQPIAVPPSVVAAEQRARALLAQAKWRKARDEIKPLVKGDRARYLPLLIEANLGLARELLAKGQASDVQPILTYLATIAPPEQLRALELELAAKAGNPADLFPRFVAALCDASHPLPEGEQLRLADQTVLAFQPVPADADPVRARLAVELRAVHDALLAISQQEWERAAAALRSIPHRSAFRHWALFLKGVIAFHGGETERAARCFAGLPPDSVPAKASQSYLLLAGRLAPASEGPPITEPVLDAACRLAGQASAGRMLFNAERQWKAGRFIESYRALRDPIAQFPTESGDWLGALTEFYFRAPYGMSQDDNREYLDFFEGLLGRRAAKNAVEEMLILRTIALTYCRSGDTWDLRIDWERYLQLLDQLHQPNPRRTAIGYAWLGERLAQPVAEFGYHGSGPRSLTDASGAMECLRKAIALDPNNLPAHLALVGVYGAQAMAAERNRLLDTMSERFPEEKPVLLEAARQCLERKAFRKGLDLLERARQLDRIDPAIPELIVRARRRLARQYFQQQRADKGRQSLAQTEEFLTDQPDDFERNRWTARLYLGLLEQLHGDAAAGESQLAEARALSPFPAAFALQAHLTHRDSAPGQPRTSPFVPALQQALKDAPSAGRAVFLWRLVRFWLATPEPPDLQMEEGLLRTYVKAAAKAPCTREEARQLIEPFGSDHLPPHLLLLFVKKVLRQDPQDPLFRLYEHTLKESWSQSPNQVRAKLQSILEEAGRRRDEATTQKVRQLLKKLERPPLPPMPPLPDFDELDDFDDGPPEFHNPFLDGAPGNLEMTEGILEVLRNASESELRKLRKNRPKNMPEALFNLLLEAARNGMPLPPFPPPLPPPLKPPAPTPVPARPRPAPLPPPPDPNQLNLF